MKLTKEESLEILWEDNKDFETVQDDIEDNSRWSIHHSLVVKQVSTGKHFEAYYSVGATEQQDEAPWEYDTEVEWLEVRAQEKVVTEYVKV